MPSPQPSHFSPNTVLLFLGLHFFYFFIVDGINSDSKHLSYVCFLNNLVDSYVRGVIKIRSTNDILNRICRVLFITNSTSEPRNNISRRPI